MKPTIKRNLIYIISFIILIITILLTRAYQGNFIGKENSPDEKFSLRYYSSFNPFIMQWSMPGGSSCKPQWVRLYNSDDTKLKEILLTDCELEMDAQWFEKRVILPDTETIWELKN